MVPDDWLPSQTFWFWIDGRIVGTSRVRTELNERFQIVGGNIGYDVRPSERKKGIGTEILRQSIIEAEDLGLVEILITCDSRNTGSIEVIEKNGGKFLDESLDQISNEIIRRYSIATSKKCSDLTSRST